MLTKGEYIVCGNKGVCMVEDISTVHMEGVDNHKLFYFLRPVGSKSSIIYIAVDNKFPTIRRILTKEEAISLLASLPDIALLDVPDDKTAEAVYKGSLHTNSIVEMVRILKTTYVKRQERIRKGRKVVAVDDKYYRLSSESLFNELAIALDMDKHKIEECILDKISLEELQKNNILRK